MKGYIYLAGPYTHGSIIIRQERFEALTKKTAELMRDGHVVFSPITHGHAIAVRHDMPVGFEFWKDQDLEMLRHAAKVIVLMLPGYYESVGVKAEIEAARTIGIDVEFHQYEP